MRARWAILSSGLIVELREVDLSNKPIELISVSQKGTVPVLIDTNGRVIEESLEIMFWALSHSDPFNVMHGGTTSSLQSEIRKFIEINDSEFKFHLDRYKYSGRFPKNDKNFHKHKARKILIKIEKSLTKSSTDHKYWLINGTQSIADWALWPFVRQYRLADVNDFDDDKDLLKVRSWLNTFLDSPLFPKLMIKSEDWKLSSKLTTFPTESRSLSSTEYIYHLATVEDWNYALSRGKYETSTRGLVLSQVGFIHACFSSQLPDIYKRYFSDLDKVMCLKINSSSLATPIRVESNYQGELFPHVYGCIPINSIISAEFYKDGYE